MEELKTCSACKEELSLEKFHKCNSRKDGLQAACKPCRNQRNKRWRDENRDRIASYGKAYHVNNRDRIRERKRKYHVNNRDRIRAYKKAYYAENLDKLRAYNRAYRTANSQKSRTHTITSIAIRAGRLVRQPCEVCGHEKVDAHHDDYSKPLEVRWLCRQHHAELHAKERAASCS